MLSTELSVFKIPEMDLCIVIYLLTIYPSIFKIPEKNLADYVWEHVDVHAKNTALVT